MYIFVKIVAITTSIYDKIRDELEKYLDQSCSNNDSYDPLDYCTEKVLFCHEYLPNIKYQY